MKAFLSDIKRVFDVIDAEKQEIDPILISVLMMAEDRRYLFHLGLDPIAVCRAVCHWFKGKIEGASTIEAQLYRTISGHREMRISRKLREAASSIVISISRPKDRIAAAYLGSAYFGFECRGIGFAAQRLGYCRAEWDLVSACDLISRLKRPTKLPLTHPENVSLRRRFQWLLRRAEAKLLPAESVAEAGS